MDAVIKKSRILLLVAFAMAVAEAILAIPFVFELGSEDLQALSRQVLLISMPISFLVYMIWAFFRKT